MRKTGLSDVKTHKSNVVFVQTSLYSELFVKSPPIVIQQIEVILEKFSDWWKKLLTWCVQQRRFEFEPWARAEGNQILQ